MSKGYYLDKRYDKYVVRATVNGRRVHVGSSRTEEGAKELYAKRFEVMGIAEPVTESELSKFVLRYEPTRFKLFLQTTRLPLLKALISIFRK